MQLKDIKQYIDWCQEGNSTLRQRLEMFKKQKSRVEQQMSQLQQYMEKINYKIAWYTEAVANNSIDKAKQNKCLAAERARIFGQPGK